MLEKFQAKKRQILNHLSKPDGSYADASPKGSVDEEIRELVEKINSVDGFVTTSSCAGRMAVFVEGPQRHPTGSRDVKSDENDDFLETKAQVASAGGKGGGRWLFSSHTPVDLGRFSSPGKILELFGFPPNAETTHPSSEQPIQFAHFKFEPMILHMVAASTENAQFALNAALTAGFRESGITGILNNKSEPSLPMVAVRTSGLLLDSIIGFKCQTTSQMVPMVTEAYLRSLLHIANQRFAVNDERKARFRQAFLDQVLQHGCVSSELRASKYEAYEPAAVRRERKRREGLLRREQALAYAGSVDGTGDVVAKGGEQDVNEDVDDYGLDILTGEDVSVNQRESGYISDKNDYG